MSILLSTRWSGKYLCSTFHYRVLIFEAFQFSSFCFVSCPNEKRLKKNTCKTKRFSWIDNIKLFGANSKQQKKNNEKMKIPKANWNLEQYAVLMLWCYQTVMRPKLSKYNILILKHQQPRLYTQSLLWIWDVSVTP